MNRLELAEAIAMDAGITRTAATQVLDSLDRVLVAQVAVGESVKWPGLFTLDVVDRPARTARNPRTGEAMELPASRQTRLRPGSRLKAAAS
ncbi:MAG: HU family DNA-binding protein [Microlunatus sp.]